MAIKSNVTGSASIITRDMQLVTNKTGNVYESINIISKRARQIAQQTKDELAGKLNDFSSPVDNLEEIFENREQIEISRFYERLPKPTLIAIEEFMEGKLSWKRLTLEEREKLAEKAEKDKEKSYER